MVIVFIVVPLPEIFRTWPPKVTYHIAVCYLTLLVIAWTNNMQLLVNWSLRANKRHYFLIDSLDFSWLQLNPLQN